MNQTNKNSNSDAKLWDLPSVDEQIEAESSSTNALNRPKRQWKYEAPDEEVEVVPLTASQIDEIRNNAFQEGLQNGHKEGFEQGLTEGKEKGYEEGLELGKSEGFNQGQQSGQQQIDEYIKKLDGLFQHLQQPAALVSKELQNELVLLALGLAKAVVKCETTTSSKCIEQAIVEGIKALPIQEQTLTVLINSEDLSQLNDYLGPDEINKKGWNLKVDDTISQGGCKVHTTNNTVDVSIERRCEQVFNQLLFNQGLSDDPRAK